MDAIRRKIVRARTGLLLEHPFFGSLCLRMEPREDPGCATAWTDGRTLAYNPGYVAGLRDEQVRGLMAHTVMHPACQHHTRRRGRDHDLWNMACDHAINWILLEAGIALPPKYLDDPAFHGLSADEIYAELHTHRAEEARPSPAVGEGEADGEVEWDGLETSSGEGEDLGDDGASASGEAGGGESGDGSDQGDPAEDGSERTGDPGGSGEVRDGERQSEGGASDESGADEQWELALAQAAQQARESGDLTGGLERLIREVLAPELDWRELLARYVADRARDDYAWTPPNKRFLGMDVILPSLSNRKLPEVVLAIDTSGSVTEAEMARFGAELSGLLETFETTVHVVYCDCEVKGAETFDRSGLPIDIAPQGGGGTDYRPAFDWVDGQGLDPACLIYLSDLECSRFPGHEPGYPVLWARVGRTGTVPPFGDVIDIP